MTKNELILPSWMASALINGDSTSLSLEDDGGELCEEQLDDLQSYLEEHNLGYCVDVSDDEEYLNSPSLDSQLAYGETLGGMFSTYTFLYNG